MSATANTNVSLSTRDYRRESFLLKLPILMVFALGCGESQPVITSSTDATGDRNSVSEKAVEYGQELSKLMGQARDLEVKREFDAAAGVWKTFSDKVVEQFGWDSWQTKNAEIAHASAIRKSGFNSSQLQQVDKIRQCNEQIKSLFQKGSDPLKTREGQTPFGISSKSSFAGNEISKALELSQNVKQLQLGLFGENSLEVGQSLIQIATLESRLDFADRAIGNFHAGIQILAQHGYSDHPELEMAHAGLASLYYGDRKYAPAVANQKVATQIAGRIWGLESLNFAAQANQLGVIYHRAGNLDVALNILRQAKMIRQQALGTNHTAYAHSCLNLGVVLVDRQQLADAEACFVEALPIFIKEFGVDNPFTNRCKSQIASIHMLRKQPELAEPLLSDIVNSMKRSNDPDVEQLVSHQYRLAVALAQQGNYNRSQPLVEQVIEKQQELFGAADKRTVTSMRAYALMLESTHQQELAAQVNQQINRVAHVVDGNDFQQRY